MATCDICGATGLTERGNGDGLAKHKGRVHGTKPDHGTLTRYQRPHNCRCKACRAANAASAKASRQRSAKQTS